LQALEELKTNAESKSEVEDAWESEEEEDGRLLGNEGANEEDKPDDNYFFKHGMATGTTVDATSTGTTEDSTGTTEDPTATPGPSIDDDDGFGFPYCGAGKYCTMPNKRLNAQC
jgi:hypothetical protein